MTELITGENDKDRRLDRILRKALPDHPLPLIHRLLRQGHVQVDGKPARAQDRVASGAKIIIYHEPHEQGTGNREQGTRKRISNEQLAMSSEVGLDVLWQGEGLIAVNKPAGLAVHGLDSLDTIVQSYLKDALPPSLSFKPGPLHRLDKPSSGIVVFSTSLEGARLFSSLMRERKIKKTYLAVVQGIIKKTETWQDCLVRDKETKKTFIAESNEGKTAITTVTPLKTEANQTLIKAEITTGRTHQIRAQAAARGYPLVGDVKYGGKKGDFFLHAWRLRFLEYCIESPVPENIHTLTKLSF